MNAPDAILGVRYGMPFDEYLAVEAVSASALRVFARSPWHYRNRIEVLETRQMLRGTLAHCAVLEPDAMAQRFVVLPPDAPRKPTRAQWQAASPSANSKAAMEWWARFGEEAAGRDLVTSEEWAICQAQIDAIRAEPVTAGLLRSDGASEVSLFWVDVTTGLYCKARPDFLRICQSAHPLDLKTCADESPSAFGRAAARLRYDIQAAHYSAGIEAVTGKPVAEFLFCAVTNKAPVLAVPYVLTDEIRDQGKEDWRALLDQLAWCRANGEWPAYGEGVQLLDFPAYAKRAGEVEVEWSEENA